MYILLNHFIGIKFMFVVDALWESSLKFDALYDINAFFDTELSLTKPNLVFQI